MPRMRRQSGSDPTLPLFDDDRRAARAYHQHRAALAERLVVEVDTDDGVRAHPLRVLAHFRERRLAGVREHVLVRAGAAADDVAHAGEEVADDVGADDRLAARDADVAHDAPALQRGGGADDHDAAPSVSTSTAEV